MKQTVVIMMVLSGLCFLPACFPHIYIHVSMSMTWFQAQEYCRSHYTDLASVHNEQELANLNEVTGGVETWIGLYPDVEYWRWSLENQDYYGEGEDEFRMWLDGEPNNGPEYYKVCGVMETDGKWLDYSCSNDAPFICYNMSTSSFIFVNEPKIWDDAQSYCREHHTDLASVRNQAENDQLKNMTITPTWIGLYRDSFKWSDGSALSFTNWIPNTPTNLYEASCVYSHNGKWGNSDCWSKRNFVCYKAIKETKVLKVVLKKHDPSVDMDELKDDIIEKLNQRLKEQGLSGVTLRWRKQPDGEIFHKMEEEEEEEEEENCASKYLF